MAKYVQRESVVMRKPISIPENVEYEPVYNRTLDWGAKRLQLQYDRFPDMKPIAVYGDGSCLFNSASMALFGNQDMSEELRVRTVIEMVTNAEKYKKHPRARDYMSLSPYYKEACVDCGKQKGWSSIWTSSLEDVQSCKRQKTSHVPLQRNSTPVTSVKPSSPQSTSSPILSSEQQRPNNDNKHQQRPNNDNTKIQEDNNISTDSVEKDSISAIHVPSEGSVEIMEDEHNHSEETSSQSHLQNKDIVVL